MLQAYICLTLMLLVMVMLVMMVIVMLVMVMLIINIVILRGVMGSGPNLLRRQEAANQWDVLYSL